MKTLVAIFHQPNTRYDNNFKKLFKMFDKNFNMYIPTQDGYGCKWEETKNYAVAHDYTSIFVICSDISFCHNKDMNKTITDKILELASDINVGSFGFPVDKKSPRHSYEWMEDESNTELKDIPFVEGFCFGVKTSIVKDIPYISKYGYAIDVWIGFNSLKQGYRNVLDESITLLHDSGISYNQAIASNEMAVYYSRDKVLYKYFMDSYYNQPSEKLRLN